MSLQEKVMEQTDKIRKALNLINIYAKPYSASLQERVRKQIDKIRKELVSIDIYAQSPEEGEPDLEELYQRAYEVVDTLHDDLEILLDIIAAGGRDPYSSAISEAH